MKKEYSGILLVTLVLTLLLPYAFDASSQAVDPPTTYTYYLNANDVFFLLCPSPQNALGTLDPSALGATSASLDPGASSWNVFCASNPVLTGNALTISSVTLTLYVCCGGRTKYALLPQLVDASTSPPTILASLDNAIHVTARGNSCQAPQKVTLDIPVNGDATLSSGQILELQFHFSGSNPATICTGSDGSQHTPSSLVIVGAPQGSTTSTTTSMTTSLTTSSSSTASTESSETSTAQFSTTSTIETSSTSSPATSTTISSVSSSSSSARQILNLSAWIQPLMQNSLLFSGLFAGLIVVASTVIALGERKS